MAAVHWMGFRCGIPVSPGVSSLREFARQRTAGARRIAGACDGSAFRRLLSAAGDKLAAPDMVGGNGGEPATERNVWAGEERDEKVAEIRAARSGGLDELQN